MSIQNDKTVRVYQKFARKYLDNNKKIMYENKENVIKERSELKQILKQIFKSIPYDSNVLEIGAGDGLLSKYIQELGYSITASDIADDFIKEIKEKGLNTIKFNILTDEFFEQYNAIICWRVFVHFTKNDIIKSLNKSYDALLNDGIFIMSLIDRKCKKIHNEWIDFPGKYHLGEMRYFNYYFKDEMDKIILNTKFEIDEYYENIKQDESNLLVYVLKKKVGKYEDK